MKRIILLSFACFLILTCHSQVMEGDFKIISIDSVNQYYMIYVQDSLGKEKLILSSKIQEDTVTYLCNQEKIETGAWCHLTLHEQRYICINRKDNYYIDLLEVDYYDGKRFIAGKYKIPYKSKNLIKLSYCSDRRRLR